MVKQDKSKNVQQKDVEEISTEELIPTPVQPLLHAYLHALEPFHSHIHGIYIFGSIALGAFEELESDVDIVILTYKEWTPQELAHLKALHTRLTVAYPLGKEMEVLYIPLHALGKLNTEIAPYPTFSHKKFSPAGYGDLNAVTWWILKNKGICLYGPTSSTLPFEITRQHLLAAMRDNLDGYWTNTPKYAYLFLLDGWIVIAMTTLCRILTTIEEDRIITKSVALTYWRDRLPPRWRPLIDEAWRIRHHLDTPSLYRSRLKRMKEVLAFIKYARQRGGAKLQTSFPQKGGIL